MVSTSGNRLRLNSGGSLNAARDIASAVGSRCLDGGVFRRVVHNERDRDRDHDMSFRASERGDLSLPRLIVITPEETCSASEALINGLAPYVRVIAVGTATCGKPVGMTVLELGDRIYLITTFRVLSARREGDCFAGLRPTCRTHDDFAHDLVNPEEGSLKVALEYIRDGRCPDRPVDDPPAS